MLRSLWIGLILGGCTGTHVTLGTASEHQVPLALRETERAFFRGSAPATQAVLAATATVARGEAAALTSDDLFDFDATPYERGDAIALTIARRWDQPMGGPAVLWAEVGGNAARLRYRLPEGLGILKDPIDLRINALGGTASFGLAVEGGGDPVQGRLHFGAGVSVARVRTSVTSALLDVHDTSFVSEPFVTMGGEVSLGKGRLFAHLREYRDTGYSVVTGFGLVLP
ncbi:MAG: hypothetical protein AAFR93_12585 [Pseudomonadota bacterium]